MTDKDIQEAVDRCGHLFGANGIETDDACVLLLNLAEKYLKLKAEILGALPKKEEEYTDDFDKTHGGYSHSKDGKRWYDLEYNQGYNACLDQYIKAISSKFEEK